MHTTLDFHLRPGPKGDYLAEVFVRGSCQPLAQTIFSYDLSFLTDFEVRQMDFDPRDPQGRLERLATFGTKLYRLLFTPEIHRLWQEWKHQATFLELCLRIAPEARGLEALPWETLYDGEEFLAAGVKTGLSRLPLDLPVREQIDPVPAPCKMLAFISSPLDLEDRERLDIEREQEILLRAVNTPAGHGKLELVCEDEAKLPILENSLGEGYHILHYSGHGIPPEGGGGLLLEDGDGRRRPTSVGEILRLMQKGERDLRLVVVSGCQTARTQDSGGFRDLARGLLQQGIPGVIAMQFSLSDTGGLRFAEHLYPRLMEGQSVPLAVSAARRSLLHDEHPQVKADAFAPVLLTAHPQPLLLTVPSSQGSMAPPTIDFSFHLPLPQLSFGFYGRRKEYRALRDGLIYRQQRAAIIHGLGGIGKTALASYAATRLKNHFRGIYAFTGSILAPETIVLGLHRFLERQDIHSLQPLIYQSLNPNELAVYLAQFLSQWPLLLIFDNFETHLTQMADGSHEIADPNLQEFLTILIQATAGGSRFLFTSRHLFEVDARRVGPIQAIPLHDLSRPESLGLMQRLTNLAPASFDEKLQAFATFGGHPYALVTLDRYCGHIPLSQVFQNAMNFKAELREFLALELSYARLSEEARNLLNCLAAFQQPVPQNAAQWVIGEKVGRSQDFLQDLLKKLDLQKMPPEMQDMNEEELLDFLQQNLPEERRAEGLDRLIIELIGWGLLSPLEQEGQKQQLAVHCLVRDFCREKQPPEIWRQNLMEAAAYYTNWTNRIKQDEKNPTVVAMDLEALELLMEAGDFESAAGVLIGIRPILGRWGLGRVVESLTRRLLPQLNRGSQSTLIHNLGILYQDRGEYETALKCFEESLQTAEELGDRHGVGASLFQIGTIQQIRGDYRAALENLTKSLQIAEELGNRAGVGASLQIIGMIQQARGDYGAALENCKKSLQTAEELGDRRGVAASLFQIGTIQQDRGDYGAAMESHEKSLKIAEELKDRKGVATSLYEIGRIRQDQGDYRAALGFFEQSLKIAEELGDRHSMANVLLRIGLIQQAQGDYEAALDNFTKSLKIAEEVGYILGIGHSHGAMGQVLLKKKEYPKAFSHLFIAFFLFTALQSPFKRRAVKYLRKLRGLWGAEEFDQAWQKATGAVVPDFLMEAIPQASTGEED